VACEFAPLQRNGLEIKGETSVSALMQRARSSPILTNQIYGTRLNDSSYRHQHTWKAEA
jgi:hypothetical protein